MNDAKTTERKLLGPIFDLFASRQLRAQLLADAASQRYETF